MTTPSDDELLKLMIAGDEDAFLTLYRRRQGPIYRFALHMSGSASIAEEVTQEVFLALLRDGRQYNPVRGSLAAYMYGVARHHVLRCLEANQPYVPISLQSSPSGQESSAQEPVAPGDILGDLTRHERIEATRRAVLSLPPNYREVVVLCDLQELSYAEAAAALNCAIGTVRSRLHRARALVAERVTSLLKDSVRSRLASPTAKAARCFV
jgi:RNA polymerase sigma-70 factor (ECF subfamily)